MKRIAIASVVQETHGFNPVKTTYADFKQESMYIGDEILENTHFLDGEMKAIFEAFKDQEEFEVVPIISTNATPSGPMVEEDYQKLQNQLLFLFDQHAPYDGVMLALHGAMSAEKTFDIEGEILQEIRQRVGPAIPICVSLDHHANITQKMVTNANT